MTAYALVVMSNPAEGREDEYNDWYTNRHLPDVLNVDGFVAAQRFKVADEAADIPFKYCAIYQVETEDLASTMAALQSRAGTEAMPLSTAMEQKLTLTVFRAVTPVVSAASAGQEPRVPQGING
jgi:hypothetical protein